MNSWRWPPALLFVGLVLIIPFIAGAFGRQLAIELLIYSLFALSIGVMYGHTGMLSFGHAGFFGVGAYTVALLIIHVDTGIGIALLAAVAVTAVLSLIVAALAVQLRGHYFALITLLAGLILYYVATGWRSLTNAEDGLSFSRPPLFGTFSMETPLLSYYFFAILVLLAMFFTWFLLLSPLGRLFRGVRENDNRPKYLGYSVIGLKTASFVYSGALAGLAGGLYALFSGYTNSEFLSWILSGEVVMWAMVGGAGSLYGPVLGATLLIWGRQVLSSQLIDIYPMIVGGIIVVTVIYLREGLAGAFQHIALRWSRYREGRKT